MILTSKYNEAFVFTADLHREHLRKGTAIPYLSHLIAVSGLVLEHGGTEDQAIAGLLHDAIEDQGDSFPGGPDALREEISKRFGEITLEIVEACTDTDEIPKPPWRERKEAYIAHLKEVDAGALLVSCADKVHNARSILSDLHNIGDELWQRFKGGKDGTLWYYRALATAFSERSESPKNLVDELDRVVTAMEQQAR